MIKIDQAISSKWMVTMGKKNLLKDHSVVIDGNIIKEITPTKNLLKTCHVANHINLKDHLLLPGFINNQTYCTISLVNKDNSHIKNNLWKEHSNVIKRYMIAEMLRNGITTFSDIGLSPDIAIEQVNQTSIRANIGLPIFGQKSFWSKDEKEYLSKSLLIYDELKNDPNINLSFHLDSITKISKNTILKVSEIANELDIPVRMSLNEDQKEIDKCKSKYKLRPLQYLQKVGLLSNTFTVMNMSVYNKADLNIIKKHKVNIVDCPNSRLMSYRGIFEIKNLIKNNFNVSLGTGDPYLNYEPNMLDEIRTTELLSKLDKDKKNNLKSFDLIKLITVNSAKSLGVSNKIGKLEIGHLADVISIKIKSHKFKEGLNIDHLHKYLKSSDIMNVWISGKRILKDKKLLTINENLLYDKLVKLKKDNL